MASAAAGVPLSSGTAAKTSYLPRALTTRRHSRWVVVASQPGSAAGSRSFSLASCSTRPSQTVCPTSSMSAPPSW